MRGRLLLAVALAICACSACAGAAAASGFPALGQPSSQLERPVFEGPVPRAQCDAGSLPETGLQGQVPLADRQSGRSKQGYRCNLELVGRHQGEGTSWVSQAWRTCEYVPTRFPNAAKSPGVQVLDVSDQRGPRLVRTLTSPAMMGPWESLNVNRRRGLLAAVSAPGPSGEGVGFFDVYDVGDDCTRPRLLNPVSTTDLSVPSNTFGHEGKWSPDGRTYWATSFYAGGITAIDVADPAHPRILFVGRTGTANHGFGLSDDGNRLYMAQAGNTLEGVTNGTGPGDDVVEPNGLQVFDVSSIQSRAPAPHMTELGHVYWTDGAFGQHALRVTYGGRPYLIFADELGAGAARIVDISDERNPRVISKLKLEIHMPEHASERSADTQGTGFFGYEGHYCTPDRRSDPTAVACGYFQSGVRVFDVRDPYRPREIAYFNPPAQTGENARLQGSEHAEGPLGGFGAAQITADWCSSPPQWVRGRLWVTCQDNGFMVLRFTGGAYPPGG